MSNIGHTTTQTPQWQARSFFRWNVSPSNRASSTNSLTSSRAESPKALCRRHKSHAQHKTSWAEPAKNHPKRGRKMIKYHGDIVSKGSAGESYGTILGNIYATNSETFQMLMRKKLLANIYFKTEHWIPAEIDDWLLHCMCNHAAVDRLWIVQWYSHFLTCCFEMSIFYPLPDDSIHMHIHTDTYIITRTLNTCECRNSMISDDIGILKKIWGPVSCGSPFTSFTSSSNICRMVPYAPRSPPLPRSSSSTCSSSRQSSSRCRELRGSKGRSTEEFWENQKLTCLGSWFK